MSGLLAHRLGSQLSRRLKLTSSVGRPLVLPAGLRTARRFLKDEVSSAEATQYPSVKKTAYDIEHERLIAKENYEPFYGWEKEDPGFDRIMYKTFMFCFFTVLTGILPVVIWCSPDVMGRMFQWRKREAILLMEERMAKGEPLIDPDFAPIELIEKMVPPPGDWEETWLRKQPAVYSDTKSKYFTQVPS